jgi:hypothetical protein
MLTGSDPSATVVSMNRIKRIFFRGMRDFFMLYTVPSYWLYWDAKLLKAREEAKNRGNV